MSEIHVIFGTGPLGKWTARELVKMGKTVRMVNRSGKADRLPAEVEVVASNAYDLRKNIDITHGASVVYQCAQPPYHEWVEKFPPLQQAILEAAAVNGAKLVVGDNLYMYGHFTGSLSEASPLAPNSKKGWVRAAMAQAVLDANAAGKVKAVIGRASNFFGPDDTALTGYAIQPAVEGKSANLMGSIDQPHTFTYIADFGRLLATIGTRDEALGKVWFAPSNPPITQRQFIHLIGVQLERPVKMRVGGPVLMRFLGLFDKTINETVEMMYEWQHPYVVDTNKAQINLGLKPTPMESAIYETITWCRENVGNHSKKESNDRLYAKA